MKLTISNSARLEIGSNPPHHFNDIDPSFCGLIRQSLAPRSFSHKSDVDFFSCLPIIPAMILVFEKFCLMFLKKEVLRWEQEKIEWIVENDDVAKLI